MRFARQAGIILVASLTLISVLFTGARAVGACSGGELTFQTLLEESTHLIRARVIERDAARQNSILLVEAALGETPIPEYILFQQRTPAAVQGVIDEFFANSCSSLALPLPEHGSFYIFVSRTETGVYETVSTFYTAVYEFSSRSPLHTLLLEADSNGDGEFSYEEMERREVDETGFIGLAEEFTGQSFARPDADSPYPVTAPLVVEIRDRGLFFVPVDLGAPYPVEPEDIGELYSGLLWSHASLFEECAPEGDVVCEVRPEPGFEAFRLYRDGEPDVFINRYGYPLTTGEQALNSAIGTTLISADRQLTFNDAYANDIYMEPQGSRPMVAPIPSGYSGASPSMVWSRDARRIAFANDEGVWLVNIAPTNNPELTGMNFESRHIWNATGYNSSEVVRFSPSGRYLTIREDGEEFNLDLTTGLQLDAGFVSPDDRFVITYHTEDGETTWQVQSLAQTIGVYEYRPLTMEGETVVQMAWVDAMTYAAVVCSQTDDSDCRVVYRAAEPGLDGYSSPFTMEPGRAFAISPRGDIAVITDDDTISVNQFPINIDTVSPIANVYWLPSLFWGE